jgi:hypothetical protein
MPFSHRQKRHLAGWGVMLVASIGVGIVLRMIISAGNHWASPAVMLALMAPLSVAAIATGIPLWRAWDEMQKEAHVTGWYWGGSVGAILGVISAFVLGGINSDLVRGAMLVCGVQFVCAVICQTGWRILHRPRGA